MSKTLKMKEINNFTSMTNSIFIERIFTIENDLMFNLKQTKKKLKKRKIIWIEFVY